MRKVNRESLPNTNALVKQELKIYEMMHKNDDFLTKIFSMITIISYPWTSEGLCVQNFFIYTLSCNTVENEFALFRFNIFKVGGFTCLLTYPSFFLVSHY